jgi:NAD(P)-dependent dehydrogenase (short-subunit alcohol dehydrogenase family)
MTEPFVLVTGGSRNIGAGICKRLSEDGLKVISTDIVAPNHEHFFDSYLVNFSNTLEAQETLVEITERYSITRLVNNVGVVIPSTIEETSIVDFNHVFQTNTLSALISTKAVLPQMKLKRFGRIVSISSRVVLGKELRTAYSASKASLLAMTRTWALELSEYGVTVNCVGPGPIGTTAFWNNNPKTSQATQSIISGIPLKRMGTIDDVAHAVSFFMNDQSSFITGQMLYVCGGLTVGLANI